MPWASLVLMEQPKLLEIKLEYKP